MTLLFIILIILASVILGFIVLIQNPKGGGLAGTFGGLGNQFMGVKQTTDVLEKGTWIFAAVIGVLWLVSSFFISGASNATAPETANPSSSNTAPLPTTPNPNPVR